MDYAGVNPAQYVVSTGGLREAELGLEELSDVLVSSTIFTSATRHTVEFLHQFFFKFFCGRIDKRSQTDLESFHLSATLCRQQKLKG